MREPSYSKPVTALARSSIPCTRAFAASAAKALLAHTQMSAEQIVEAALKIAGEICIYTNTNVRVETV